MNARLRALLARKVAALAKAKAISESPAGEGDEPDLTEEQRTEFTGHMESITVLNGDIALEQALDAEAATAQPLEVSGDPAVTGGIPVILQDPKRGFDNFAQFCAILLTEGGSWKAPSSIGDERLQIMAALPSAFGSEGVGADGGFLVAPEFGTEIFTHSLEQDALIRSFSRFFVASLSFSRACSTCSLACSSFLLPSCLAWRTIFSAGVAGSSV